MHWAFDRWMVREFPGCPFEGHADDTLAHCRTRRQAQYVLGRIEQRMRAVGLRLHADKTKIVYCKDGRRRGEHEHTRFTFLGYTFRAREAHGKSGGSFTPRCQPPRPDEYRRVGLAVAARAGLPRKRRR
jgi:RNA-directed DNA polymerase